MRPLILATTLWLALLTPAFAQPFKLPQGDVSETTLTPIDLSDTDIAYGIYKCVITNEIIEERLPFFVNDLGWGLDKTRRFIYGFIYIESRIRPYDISSSLAYGLLQQRQIHIDQWVQLTGKPRFLAEQLSDSSLDPTDTYLLSLTVLDDMARTDGWTTVEMIASKWLCGDDAKCKRESDRLQYIANLETTIADFAYMENNGIACVFQCNMEPWKLVRMSF